MLSREDCALDAALLRTRLVAALERRRHDGYEPSAAPGVDSAARLVHGEADGLPGLIVDRYGDTLSAQFLSAGTERWKKTIAAQLVKLSGAARLYERSESGVRGLEGLEPATG